MSYARGRLITLEGGEGAGKTTQARFIAAWLRAQGREVVTTREPGGSPLAEAIRRLVLADWNEGVAPITELLLIFAARSAHLQATVLPALQRGCDVVCDRFVDASWAYQGAGRGVEAHKLAAIEQMVLGDLRPDLTLVFDIDPSVGLARAQGRGDTNRFEAETLAFMQRVRQAYLDRAASEPQRCVVIDASLPSDAVGERIQKILEQRL
ncbi:MULTISPECIES: dTMP kinase [Hydrocarboniphaga]|uniref:Thymidylate kinase n=1 Tax=Hydrocarboniphaga effusa AP103 TaxID=1172194 RepID=I7Z777_9GAMM|nr:MULTISPECIES: dTMP kinase [Hydrocarboniphaga]EIT67644.1 thymidylate kinase [Hydrocarboniphaga effusa AP103]MDZ4080228.1 dTMP kinase [Hydrocarboniphaga sp.]